MNIRNTIVIILDEARRKIEHFLPTFVKNKLKPFYRSITGTISTGKKKVSVQDMEAKFIVSNPKTLNMKRIGDEEEIIADIAKESNVDDIFYDVGSNIGTYSFILGEKFEKIIAFEPHPKNAERYRENIKINNANADLYEVALSDDEGSIDLLMREADVGSTHNRISTDSTSDRDNNEKMQSTASVDMTTLDKIISDKKLENPDIIKIDIQGAEYDALRGMKETLRSSEVRLIYIESHPKYLPKFDATVNEIVDLLEEYGFSAHKLNDDVDDVYIKAVRN
jgi:FkbM family methyltransferase